jgi:hypothetical protein
MARRTIGERRDMTGKNTGEIREETVDNYPALVHIERGETSDT